MGTRFSTLTKEPVRVMWEVDKDPTGDIVGFAFTNGADPTAYITGAWVGTYANGIATAEVYIGPGSTVGSLAVGRWAVWSKVTDNPAIPVQFAGWIDVF